MPQYFFYMLPYNYSTDLSVYDSLLVSMIQMGANNYVLKNTTKNRMEAFSFPVFTDYWDTQWFSGQPEKGGILPYKNGMPDESFWTWPPHESVTDYQIYRSCSESEMIEHIKTPTSNIKPRYERSVLTLDFLTQEGKELAEFVAPFKNGVFSHQISPVYEETRVTYKIVFTRYINGCQTDETITIDTKTETIVWSDARYTPDDIAQMENLSLYISQRVEKYAQEIPTPTRVDPEGKELMCFMLYAWYAKVDGKTYGVIKTVWRYRDVPIEDVYHSTLWNYYDDEYTLYDMSEHTVRTVSRDDLRALLGDRNVYQYNYEKEGTTYY